jgi:hypothetical protein
VIIIYLLFSFLDLDDIESIAYALIHMLKGRLSWQGLPADDDTRGIWNIIYDVKSSYPTTKLCEDLPEEFRIILEYSRKLQFNDVPNYNYLVKLLKKLAVKKGFDLDDIYPWTVSI